MFKVSIRAVCGASLLRLLGVLLLIVVSAPQFSPALAAPAIGQWSIAERLSIYAAETFPPYLVADRNRSVHAIASQVTGGETAVVYSRWTLESGWSDPVDVLLSPDGLGAKPLGALLDDVGVLHVAFYGGNERGAAIYY